MKKYKRLILPIYIILNILYVFVGSYLFMEKKIEYSSFAANYKYLLISNVVVILILFIIKKIKKEELKLGKIDIFIGLIIVFSIISVIFAINKDVALNGIECRYEGLYSILYYFSIMYLCTFVDKKYKRIIVMFILINGIYQLIYALRQITLIGSVVRIYNKGEIWATGLTNNPNFFGSFMLICLCLSLGLFIDEKKKVFKVIYGMFLPLFSIGISISNTLSSFVGLFVVFIFSAFYCIKNKRYEIILIFFLLIYLAVLTTHMFGHTKILNDFTKFTKETKEIVKGNINEDYGTKRIFIWKNTLKIVPDNLLNGVGIDNFYYAFGSKPLSKGRFFFDKAHNEYLQILITEGIFALISYLCLYFIIVKRGVKRVFKNKQIYLLLPVIGYLVQAFFNFSVVEVAPFFYICLGLCVERK